jgi:hypothetical protein
VPFLTKRIATWKKPKRECFPHPEIVGAYVVPLTQGFFAIVDSGDIPAISQWSWSVMKIRYGTPRARANVSLVDGTVRHIQMQQLVIDCPDGFEIDHIDGNGLNNRRSNLRACEHRFNLRNITKQSPATSKYKGVSYYRRDQKWRAHIVIDAKQKHLGYFCDEIAAALAYDACARSLFGEFARLNFPEKAGA